MSMFYECFSNSHRMDRISYFYDSKLLTILPKGSVFESSLMNCVVQEDDGLLTINLDNPLVITRRPITNQILVIAV